ncbi:uncharacterized protein [Nicotiana sylvestris]|uniref:uncharacterized protein n=1 Tax=Nicotiana sylvestris TaxID=4096 RepID=UPI00388CE315
MAPFEALYGRRCRSPIGWFEVGKAGLLGTDLVHHAMEKVKVIQERMKTAQSRQKSYADVRRRELEFQADDWVFLKISPIKGVIRFRKKGKLSPRKVVGDPSTIVPFETIEVNEELSYEEVPVAILDSTDSCMFGDLIYISSSNILGLTSFNPERVFVRDK